MISGEVLRKAKIETRLLTDDGIFPNNDQLPLIIYKNALKWDEPNIASVIEQLLADNTWGNSWRNGIYDFHHYHSTAHEVLVCYSGSARVQLGGDKNGIVTEMTPGDVAVLPAGTAHKNLGSSKDFRVIGAYPAGQNWDMNYGRPEERPRADENIARTPLPEQDPLYGKHGPLLDAWGKK